VCKRVQHTVTISVGQRLAARSRWYLFASTSMTIECVVMTETNAITSKLVCNPHHAGTIGRLQ
jgi:acyl-CoA hydrolase